MGSLSVEPSVANVGTRVRVRGTGLKAKASHVVRLAGTAVASFETTARGTIPANTAFQVPETHALGEKGERSTRVPIEVWEDGRGVSQTSELEIRAAIQVDAGSSYLGQEVGARANGLLPEQTYDVVMLTPSYHAYTVGVLVSDSRGSGETKFVIPGNLRPGVYMVDLIHHAGGYPTMSITPTLRVEGYGPDALIAGAPTSRQHSGILPTIISIPFENATGTSLSPVVYAIVSTARGRPILITSSAAMIPPKSTRGVDFGVADLPKGKYKITAFAATGTGQIVSRMFSFYVRI